MSAQTDYDLSILAGHRAIEQPSYLITIADTAGEAEHYRQLRHDEFVMRQQLFPHTDRDDVDDDPRTTVLLATTTSGELLGGVRVAPCTTEDIGWWAGSRLVVSRGAPTNGIGAALVRAACAHVESLGALRFDATVQSRYAPMFCALGWQDTAPGHTVAGRAHRLMRWPITCIQRTVDATKSILAEALTPLAAMPGGLGPAGYRGDDGTPLPGTDVIAACDAIIPALVDRDPEWAGWCSVLVNINDLTAMGATPTGLLDAVGAPTASHLTRIIRGIAAASQTWQTPVIGGHTQLGVPAALSVTALGRTATPIRAGGGRVGHTVSITADLAGQWRPGYHNRQWDSTTSRSSAELCTLSSLLAAAAPAAAKDVSMAGLVGTLGMLAESSGTGAEVDVSRVPRPAAATMGAWLTCFPGYAMVTTDTRPLTPPPSPAVTAACGRLISEPGVHLRWPDGVRTVAVASSVTGLGIA